jgi:hypothetical protein
MCIVVNVVLRIVVDATFAFRSMMMLLLAELCVGVRHHR